MRLARQEVACDEYVDEFLPPGESSKEDYAHSKVENRNILREQKKQGG